MSSKISLDSTESLCVVCNNYLSIPPIFLIETVGTICGRCKKVKSIEKSNPTQIRQLLYEDQAKSISFPCRYDVNGCLEKLKWGKIEQHEKKCRFLLSRCFYGSEEFVDNSVSTPRPACDWTGTGEQLYQHLEEKHKLKFDKSSITIQGRSDMKNSLFLKKFRGGTLLIVFLINDDAIYCAVMTSIENECLMRGSKYSIKINNSASKIPYSVSAPYISKKTGTVVEKIGVKINKSLIEGGFITLILEENRNNPFVIIRDVPESFLCDSCDDKLSSKIFMCSKKHMFCKNCTEHDMNCLICETFTDHETNYNFKKIVEVKSCKNKSDGCFFHDIEGKIEKHQKSCYFLYFYCWKCNKSVLLKNFYSHVIERGENVHFDTFYSFAPSTDASYYYYLFCNQIFVFKIYCDQQKSTNYMKMFHVNQEDLDISSKYIFEITIRKRNSLSGESISFKKNVLIFSDRENMENLEIPNNFLNKILNGEKEFKINLFKVND